MTLHPRPYFYRLKQNLRNQTKTLLTNTQFSSIKWPDYVILSLALIPSILVSQTDEAKLLMREIVIQQTSIAKCRQRLDDLYRQLSAVSAVIRAKRLLIATNRFNHKQNSPIPDSLYLPIEVITAKFSTDRYTPNGLSIQLSI